MFGYQEEAYCRQAKSYNSSPQILDILLFIAILLQLVLGYSPSPNLQTRGTGTIMGRVHRYLGPIMILLGVVNGGIGFDFSYSKSLAYVLPYSIVPGIAGIFTIRMSLKHVRNSRNTKGNEQEMHRFERSGWGHAPPSSHHGPEGNLAVLRSL